MEERYYNKEFDKLFKDCISDIKTLIGDKEISLEGEGIFPTDNVQQELYALCRFYKERRQKELEELLIKLKEK
jgi:hypothetical protein